MIIKVCNLKIILQLIFQLQISLISTASGMYQELEQNKTRTSNLVSLVTSNELETTYLVLTAVNNVSSFQDDMMMMIKTI